MQYIQKVDFEITTKSSSKEATFCNGDKPNLINNHPVWNGTPDSVERDWVVFWFQEVRLKSHIHGQKINTSTYGFIGRWEKTTTHWYEWGTQWRILCIGGSRGTPSTALTWEAEEASLRHAGTGCLLKQACWIWKKNRACNHKIRAHSVGWEAELWIYIIAHKKYGVLSKEQMRCMRQEPVSMPRSVVGELLL